MKEANLPPNVSPENSELKDPEAAPPHRPRLFARTDRAFRLRAAGPALAGEGRGHQLAQRKMEDPPRRAASRPRRQPGRLPPAFGRAALCSARLLPLYRRGRSDRAARAFARFPRRAGARAAGRLVRRGGRGGAGARRAAARRYRRRRPHRGDRRAARRTPMRLPAAGRAARGLSRTRRRGRGGGGKGRAARCRSRATRRRSIRASTSFASRRTRA